MLTIITPTGARPEAFAQCKRLMQRQLYSGPVYWIIIDDGAEHTDTTFEKEGWRLKVIRPEQKWKPGDNTQRTNLLLGLDEAERFSAERGEPLRLTVWEDDDWYAPTWLSTLVREMESAELVGEIIARYYNVRSRRYDRLHNFTHASLRCSGMRDGALKTFREVLGSHSQYYDFKLWKAHKRKRVFRGTETVGIKGLPGRPGIAIGHLTDKGRPDFELTELRKMIGDDVDFYAEFYEESLNMTKPSKTKKMKALVSFKYGELGQIHEGDVFHLRSNEEEHLFLANGRACNVDAETAPTPKRTRSRKLKTVTQEEKLAENTVEKADANQEDKEEEPQPKSSPFSRRKRKTVKKSD